MFKFNLEKKEESMISNEYSYFMRRLDTLKVSSNKSYNEIEKDLGYPRNALSNYKNGSVPSGARLLELANYFGVSPEYLLGEKSRKDITLLFESLEPAQKHEMVILCQKWILSNLKY